MGKRKYCLLPRPTNLSCSPKLLHKMETFPCKHKEKFEKVDYCLNKILKN